MSDSYVDRLLLLSSDEALHVLRDFPKERLRDFVKGGALRKMKNTLSRKLFEGTGSDEYNELVHALLERVLAALPILLQSDPYLACFFSLVLTILKDNRENVFADGGLPGITAENFIRSALIDFNPRHDLIGDAQLSECSKVSSPEEKLWKYLDLAKHELSRVQSLEEENYSGVLSLFVQQKEEGDALVRNLLESKQAVEEELLSFIEENVSRLVQSLKSVIDMEKIENSVVSDLLGLLTDEFLSHVEGLQEFRSLIQSKEEEAAVMKQDIESLEKKLAETMAELRLAVSEAQSKLTEADIRLFDLSYMHDVDAELFSFLMKQRLLFLKEDLQVFKDGMMQLKVREIQTFKEKMQSRDLEIETRKEQMQEWEVEVGTLKEQLQQREVENVTLKERIQVRDFEIDTRKEQMHHREVEVGTLKEQLQQMEVENVNLKDQILLMEVEVGSCFEILKECILDLSEEVKCLQDRLEHVDSLILSQSVNIFTHPRQPRTLIRRQNQALIRQPRLSPRTFSASTSVDVDMQEFINSLRWNNY